MNARTVVRFPEGAKYYPYRHRAAYLSLRQIYTTRWYGDNDRGRV